MRDIKLNGMINVLAASSLLVTASGCGGTTAESLANDYCDLYKECDSVEFDEDYDSIDECVEEATKDVESLKERSNEECYDAMLDYTACYLDLVSGCNEDYDDDACEKEEDAAEEACEEFYGSYDDYYNDYGGA